MDARQIKSRKKIEQALVTLLEKKSLEELSIEEIALAAGVSRPTFYRNYSSRQAILDGAMHEWQDNVDHKINCLRQEKAEPSVNLLASYFQIIFESIEPNNHLLHLAILGHASANTQESLQERGHRRAVTLIEDSYGESLSKEDIDFIADFATAAMDRILQKHLQGNHPWDIETTSFNVAQLIHLGVNNYKPYQSDDGV